MQHGHGWDTRRRALRRLLLALGAVGCLGAVAVALALANSDSFAPDTSFGNQGTATVSFPAPPGSTSLGGSEVDAIAVQGDGSTIVAGTGTGFDSQPAHQNVTQFCVARLTPAGGLDHSFGSNGFGCVVPESDTLGQIYALRVQADNGDIVLVGTSTPQSGANANRTKLVLARFTSAGQPDGTFGAGGVVLGDTLAASQPVGVVLDAADEPIVGEVPLHTNTISVSRFTAGGGADSTFTVTPLAMQPAQPSGGAHAGLAPLPMVALPNGQVLVVGASTPQQTVIAVQRVNATGGVDASYGTGGMATVTGGATNEFANDATLQGTKLLISGTITGGGGGDRALEARLLASGALDATFATGGRLGVAPPSGANAFGGPLVVDPGLGIDAVEGMDTGSFLEDTDSNGASPVAFSLTAISDAAAGGLFSASGGDVYVGGESNNAATVDRVTKSRTPPAPTTTASSPPPPAPAPPPPAPPARPLQCRPSPLPCADLTIAAVLGPVLKGGAAAAGDLVSGDRGLASLHVGNLGPDPARCLLGVAVTKLIKPLSASCGSAALASGAGLSPLEPLKAPVVRAPVKLSLTATVAPSGAYDPVLANDRALTSFMVFPLAAQVPHLQVVGAQVIAGDAVLRQPTARAAATAGRGAVSAVRSIGVAIMDLTPGRCRWVSSSNAKRVSFTKAAAVCPRPVFLRAAGTTKWTVALRHRLPKGSYLVLAQVMDVSGARSSLEHGGRPEAHLKLAR